VIAADKNVSGWSGLDKIVRIVRAKQVQTVDITHGAWGSTPTLHALRATPFGLAAANAAA
jgi:hypothetical protein